MNNQAIRKIVIVGGGSAAWLIACRLASRYCLAPSHYKITLVESPDIATVGVGEGTWPTMRSSLKKIGLSESQFIRHCSASFKQGTCFKGWRNGSSHDCYYHPFELPKWHQGAYLSEDWPRFSDLCAAGFDDAVSIQPSVCELNLAPKHLKNAEYEGVLNYGYHLNASAFATMLKNHGTTVLGVEHIVDHVGSVHLDDDGWITHLDTKNSGSIDGDFYFDCSGFNALLVNKTMGVDYLDLRDQLFVDRALASQIPYLEPISAVSSATISTAHAAGWIWDIGLRDRRGVGCVYSSAHMTEERAQRELSQYLGPNVASGEIRSLKFEARHLSRFWHKNAVAVGLSSGFVEPLEASALVLVELTADWFCERFPSSVASIDVMSQRYNELFTAHWRSIVDFLKLHYVLSSRNEDFWADNRQESSISESLKARLSLWEHCAPSMADPNSDSPIFAWQSYLYIFNGMKQVNLQDAGQLSEQERQLAKGGLAAIEKMKSKAKQLLPDNRSLLERLQSIDMSKI